MVEKLFQWYLWVVVDWTLQGVAVGEDLVKLKYTTASAVKEKEGKLMCQGEVLTEGITSISMNHFQYRIITVHCAFKSDWLCSYEKKNCHFISTRVRTAQNELWL